MQWLLLAVAAPFVHLEALLWDLGWVAVGLLVIQQAWRFVDEQERWRPFDLDVTWPALGLGAVAIVALLLSPYPPQSWPQVLGLLFNIAIYTTIVSALRACRPDGAPIGRLRVGLAIYAALGVLVAVVAFLHTTVRPDNPALVTALWNARPALPEAVQLLLTPIIRPTNHPNTVAGALLLFLPVYVALLAYRPWRAVPDVGRRPAPTPRGSDESVVWTAASGAALAIVGCVFLLTLSRGGLIALGLSLLSMLFWRWRRLARASVRPALVVAALLGLSWLGSLLWGWPTPIGAVIGAVDATRQDPASVTFAVRVAGWASAIEVIGRQPWLGIGPNRTFLYLTPINPLLGHAHNLFLQVALDFGLPGLFLFVALVGLVALRAYRGLRALAGTPHEVIAAGLAAGLAAHLIWSMADTLGQGLVPTAYLWVALGLAACLPTTRVADRPAVTSVERATPTPLGNGVATPPERRPSKAARRRRSRRRLEAR